MSSVSLYGLNCPATEEAEVARRINASLAKIKRTMSKATQKSLLDGQKPFLMKHYFWNLNRDAGVYFELLSNEDLQGQWHRRDHKKSGLLLLFIVQDHSLRDGAPLKKAAQYIDRVVRATAVPHELIVECDDREEALPIPTTSPKSRARKS
jgi:hypothetical protein